jgi:hypothetical protein
MNNDQIVYLKINNITSDMKQIDFYSREEHKIFERISKNFKSIKNGYSSPNSDIFANVGKSILSRRDYIKSKRGKYNDVLKRNIELYREAAGIVVGIMSESGDSDER